MYQEDREIDKKIKEWLVSLGKESLFQVHDISYYLLYQLPFSFGNLVTIFPTEVMFCKEFKIKSDFWECLPLLDWVIFYLDDFEIIKDEKDKNDIHTVEVDSDKLKNFIDILDDELNRRKYKVSPKSTWFDGNSFYIKLKNGETYSLTFENNNKGNIQFQFLKILFENYQKYRNGLSNEEAKSFLKKSLSKDINSELNDVVSNIKKKIRKNSLENIIQIEFDKSIDGYKLNIKK